MEIACLLNPAPAAAANSQNQPTTRSVQWQSAVLPLPLPSVRSHSAPRTSSPPPVVAKPTPSIAQTGALFSGELGRREWANVVQDMLAYLINHGAGSDMVCNTVQIVPPRFFAADSGYYCYPFKGRFLPTGSSDGCVWRSSQGSIKTRTGLIKRYFYCPGTKVTRQVTWLASNEEWCFVEYRVNAKTEVRSLDNIQSPPGINLRKLMTLSAGSFKNKGIATPVESKSPNKRVKVEKREDSVSSGRSSPLDSWGPIGSSAGTDSASSLSSLALLAQVGNSQREMETVNYV